jgi:hypothetical protein
MTKPYLSTGLARLILAALIGTSAAGCSALTTTTDGIAAGFGSTTDATGSTTPDDKKSTRAERTERFVLHRFESIRFEAARGAIALAQKRGQGVEILARAARSFESNRFEAV